MIRDEQDVRAWVRKAAGNKVRWVEPSLGSTPGLPDCWVPVLSSTGAYGAYSAHLELKAARLCRGHLRYAVRPEQRKEICAMVDDQIAVGFLIGIKDTSSLIFALPTPAVIDGRWALDSEAMVGKWFEVKVGQAQSFWSGVNFIFFES